MLPEHQFICCDGLEVHLTCWGHPQAPALVLWHGLTRTGRDFDELARNLSDRWYVICPDTPGRGLSQWSQTPEQDYILPRYVDIARQVLSALSISECVWIGTSMGGLIGMLLAAEEETPVRALLVNDVGPELPEDALQRIRTYISVQPVFRCLTALETWLKQVYVTFGPNSDAFWRRLAMTSSRRLPDGTFTLHYDPALVDAFQVPSADQPAPTLWPQWQAIRCPLMIIQGAESDLLLPATLQRMRTLQPQAEVMTLDGIGHAPTLVTDDQQRRVVQWLDQLSVRFPED
ncbi:MAG: alpha/beta fold hydrolase [Nitrincola lacisaponensis]|uniref:alpha/beta fold hydrolase n=1 Tax=Nitrincola lacisaponensis TaxID=267850 RepID=UPI00391C6872